jgi:iron-sulfur cluster assembly accessory protein
MNTIKSTSIAITEKAKQELRRLEVGGNRFLRLNVVSGGCSGMTYSAGLDDAIKDGDDVLFEDADIKVVAEGGTAFFLEGLTIDYSDDLIRSGFRFINKNAKGSCGCGSSFKA